MNAIWGPYAAGRAAETELELTQAERRRLADLLSCNYMGDADRSLLGKLEAHCQMTPLSECVLVYLSDIGDSQSLDDISEAVGVSTSQLAGLCIRLLQEGKLEAHGPGYRLRQPQEENGWVTEDDQGNWYPVRHPPHFGSRHTPGPGGVCTECCSHPFNEVSGQQPGPYAAGREAGAAEARRVRDLEPGQISGYVWKYLGPGWKGYRLPEDEDDRTWWLLGFGEGFLGELELPRGAGPDDSQLADEALAALRRKLAGEP